MVDSMASTPVCKKGFSIVVLLSALFLLSGCTALPRTKGCMDEPLRNYIKEPPK